MDFHLKRVLEALLFSTSEPLSIKDLQTVFTRFSSEQAKLADEQRTEDDKQQVIDEIFAQTPSMVTATQIRDALDDLAADLDRQQSVFEVALGPNGYSLRTKPEFAEWIRLLRGEPRPKRLTSATLETLAIVAYRQPVTRAEIEAIRGVSADGALNRLIDQELVAVSGRADLPGRPIQYGTTDQFLEFCGIRGLEELPASDAMSPSVLTEFLRRSTQGEVPVPGDAEMGLAEENA